MTAPRIAPLGDEAISVRWEEGPDTRGRVRAAAARLSAAGITGVRDLLPAYSTLGVFYDSSLIDYDTIAARVHALVEDPGTVGEAPPGREITIPVRYDGADLGEVARRTGLSESEVVARHSGRWYEVLVVGFVPGWAYLGSLDPVLVLPRRESPRQRVPQGSVAIAGTQTGVYPFATPGGWHLIGRTDRVMFDPTRESPALLGAGDRVRFDPVSP